CGVVIAGFLAAIVLWPSKDRTAIKHIHYDLDPSHPHLSDAKQVDGGYEHTHDYVIDYHHRTWP
ncbi:MAG: MFS transporter, partial [Candidatus Dadabacteria bacterium]|nr:MFS transporter [Candidatus Dadabacteria bacterium]